MTLEEYPAYEVLAAGNPLLKEISKEIDPTSEKARIIVSRMHKTIEALGGGIGLAAPQVGELVRIFIFHIPENNSKNAPPLPWSVVINPKIEILSEEKSEDWEGCFCFPNLMIKVARFEHIKYSYYDLDGNSYEKEAKGYHARAVQHEIDHLNGVLFMERLETAARFNYSGKIL